MNVYLPILVTCGLLAAAVPASAIDEWGEAVDIAVCHPRGTYRKTLARAEQWVKAHNLNGFVMEFYHDENGQVQDAPEWVKPEGFLVVVKDVTVPEARKLLAAEIACGLRIRLLHRSIFFPERNTQKFICRNGSWDAPDLDLLDVFGQPVHH